MSKRQKINSQTHITLRTYIIMFIMISFVIGVVCTTVDGVKIMEGILYDRHDNHVEVDMISNNLVGQALRSMETSNYALTLIS